MYSPCTKKNQGWNLVCYSYSKKTVKENHSFTWTAKGRDLNTSVPLITNCIRPLQRENGHSLKLCVKIYKCEFLKSTLA